MYALFASVANSLPREHGRTPLRDWGTIGTQCKFSVSLLPKLHFWRKPVIAEQLGCCSSSVEHLVSFSPRVVHRPEIRHTFHFSISCCLLLYCFTRSSKTFLRPSEFVFRAGTTSFTVLSTRTPFIIRKHFRSPESGSRVSRTSLRDTSGELAF